MSDKTTAWDSLSMKDKAFHIKNAVKYGFSKDLNEIKDMYNYIATMEKVAKDNYKNWGESEDKSSRRILNSRYFNEDITRDYLKNSPVYLQLPKKKYDGGGPTDENTEYNIFEDSHSFEARDAHRKSLDAFVKNNPKLYGLNTADFVEFLSQIAGLESGYRSKATNSASTYSGYYGLKNGHTFDVNTQHKKAFQHLASIFKENMTKQDIDKANSLGITPAQLLAKYWNQGNRVTNYLYNNIDNEDALGTKISKYGWNVTAPVEYRDLVPEAITDSYIIIEDARSLPDGIVRARNNSIDYSNREKSILQLNDSINPYGFMVKKFNPNTLQKGQKVKLMSDDERKRKLLVKKLMDSFNVDSLLNNPYSKYINNIMNSWKQ